MWGYTPREGLALVAGSKVYPNSHDRRAMYPLAVGVDMLKGEGVDFVHDLTHPLKCTFEHVDCCSVLEHCADPWAVARNLSDALVSGGTLLLSVPFCWRVHAYPSDYWRFTAEGIRLLFPAIEFKHLAYAFRDRESARFKVLDSEKDTGLLPKCEVVGWGVKR